MTDWRIMDEFLTEFWGMENDGQTPNRIYGSGK